MLKINVLVKNLSCKKFQSNSDAKLKIAIVFLSENNKNEYQHSISSTSNINFMSVLRFEGGLFKKVPRAVSKRGPTSKKFWMSHFFGSRQKSNTHASRDLSTVWYGTVEFWKKVRYGITYGIFW